MSFSFSSNSQAEFENYDMICPKCSLVPFINISNDENNLFMSIKCINDHNETNYFDKMENKCKSSSISNYLCVSCKNRLNNIFYYCSKCFKFFCLNHGEIHGLNGNHEVFLNKNLNSVCFEHKKSIVGYCYNHNKNYCVNCNHFKENNQKIDYELNDEEIKKYENEIKKNKKIFEEINVLFNDYIKIIKELKDNFLFIKKI